MAVRFTECSIDATNPTTLANWWCRVLGWVIVDTDDADGYVAIGSSDRVGPTLAFARVPETKTTKNRLHIDLSPVGCEQPEELERLLALGAARADIGQGDDKSWVVLRDPEGNEFCLLRPRVG